MKISSDGIINGKIDDKYGKYGKVNHFGMPTCSIPLKFEDYPKNTVSFAIFLEDKDAFPVSGGFSWVHWVACNIKEDYVKENASQNANFVQGVNSWISIQGGSNSSQDCAKYGGMAPPDADHIYEINVYALDTTLELKNGFFLNEMFRAMEGHILDSAILKGSYRK